MFRAVHHCSWLCSHVSSVGAGRGWVGRRREVVAASHAGLLLDKEDPCPKARHGCALQAQGRQMAAAASAPPPRLLAVIAARGQERHNCSRISPEPCWFPVWAPRVNPRRGKSEPAAMRELGQEQPWPCAGLGAGNRGMKALWWCGGGSPMLHPSSGIQAGKAGRPCLCDRYAVLSQPAGKPRRAWQPRPVNSFKAQHPPKLTQCCVPVAQGCPWHPRSLSGDLNFDFVRAIQGEQPEVSSLG